MAAKTAARFEGGIDERDKKVLQQTVNNLNWWHRMSAFGTIIPCVDPKPCCICDTMEELSTIVETGKRVRK